MKKNKEEKALKYKISPCAELLRKQVHSTIKILFGER